MRDILNRLDGDRPILLAGPTASGKSDLALQIAERFGGAIVNADALQVYATWRVLTARPSREDEARTPHRLYGHVPGDAPYSVGDWLRDVAPLLKERPAIVVGGTGLYFTRLTRGLAEIPPIPPEVRAAADRRASEDSAALLADLDAPTRERIDATNPARVKRAWEVLRATGRGLAQWQAVTPAPLLPLEQTQPIVLELDRDALNGRIARRAERMFASGAVEEVRNSMTTLPPDAPAMKAIGARDIAGYICGNLSLDEARERFVIATRQYAKRQRTWFRSNMKDWAALSNS